MKYLLRAVIINIFFAFLLFGQRSDLSGLKFCIDPGHGGHNAANDRYLIPDPGTAFWESESNMQKAFHLKSLLESQGATVILTRYTNDYPNDNDEPSLTVRVALANSNNVDWFHSIHSNATGGNNTSTNYTLMLVREKRSLTNPFESSANGMGIPERQESLTMANIIGSKIKTYNRTSRTSTSLDWTFYGGVNGGFSLGVIRGLSMPGQLSEGSFHDYFPETRRLMNNDYRKVEAYAIRNAFMEFYGVPKDKKNIIAGIVRDLTFSTPVNKLKVKLLPKDTTYLGDVYNNGYYMFDNLDIGQYTLIFESDNYIKDSLTVNIASEGSIVFADKNLINSVPPKVSNSIPVNNDSTVSVYNPITLNFSKPMDTTSIRTSLSIIPSLLSTFQWSNSNMTLKITPLSLMESKMTYNLAIDTSARDIGGYRIDGDGNGTTGDPYLLTFRTLISDDERPNILSTNPTKFPQVQNFSTQGVISIAFTKLMDTSSLRDNISLRRFSVPVESEIHFTNLSDKTIVTIKPKNDLEKNSSYVVLISNSVRDIYFNIMKNPYYIVFNTNGITYKNIKILESYTNGVSNWWQPSGSGSTIGIVTEKTSFSEDTNIYLPWTSDKKSGRLIYTWDTTSNIFLIREYLSQGIAYNTLIDTAMVLQAYIFGDGSNNKIRFCIDDNFDLSSHRVNNWITIDWNGWKLIEWKFTNSDELGYWFTAGSIISPKIRFDSYQLTYNRQTCNPTGTIYFDALRIAEIDKSVNIIKKPDYNPVGYELRQNYPNPFNPSTNIQFRIADNGLVILKIFDLLGREITTLLNEELLSGEYSVEFNSKNLSSGIYLYKLSAPKFIETKKMQILK